MLLLLCNLWILPAFFNGVVLGCTGTGTTNANNDAYGYNTNPNNNNYGAVQPAQPYSFQRALSDAVGDHVSDNSNGGSKVLKNAEIPLTAEELAETLASEKEKERSPGQLAPAEDAKFKHIIRAGDKIPQKSYLSKYSDDYSLDIARKGPSKPPVSVYRLSFNSGRVYVPSMAICTSIEAKRMWYGENGLRNTWRSGLAGLINRSPGGCVPCLKVAEDLEFEKVTQGPGSNAITHAILSTDIPAAALDTFLQSLALKNMQGLVFVGIQPMDAKEVVTTCR